MRAGTLLLVARRKSVGGGAANEVRLGAGRTSRCLAGFRQGGAGVSAALLRAETRRWWRRAATRRCRDRLSARAARFPAMWKRTHESGGLALRHAAGKLWVEQHEPVFVELELDDVASVLADVAHHQAILASTDVLVALARGMHAEVGH